MCNGADFFTLCCPYFCFVPCPVVTHTAAYCQILFFKVDVLPSQTTDLSNTQACTNPDGTTAKALSKGYLRLFSAVLQGAFRFAVFPKRLITFNPMQYVVWRGKKEEYELFSDEDGETTSTPTLSYEQYQRLEDFLKKNSGTSSDLGRL